MKDLDELVIAFYLHYKFSIWIVLVKAEIYNNAAESFKEFS